MANACGSHLPSCYRRLKIFSKEIAEQLGERIISVDLDVCIVGEMASVWDRPGSFIGWKVQGAIHPNVYNGSMFMFEAGKHTDIWSTFDPHVSPQQSRLAGYFGSDQGWISFKLKGRLPGWGRAQGVYSYPRDLRRKSLPSDARIVIFHGKRKPWDENTTIESPWVADHWRIK